MRGELDAIMAAIELRGGPAHGRRMIVPKGTSEAAIPVTRNVDGGYLAAAYRPNGQYTDDGVALWSPTELCERLEAAKQRVDLALQVVQNKFLGIGGKPGNPTPEDLARLEDARAARAAVEREMNEFMMTCR